MKLIESLDNGVNRLNREGYEWFMHFLWHPIATYDDYRLRSPSYPGLRLAWSVFWRLPLMIVPVIPAVYVLTRLATVVFNPIAWYKNFIKPAAMTFSLALLGTVSSILYHDFVYKPLFADSAKIITQILPWEIGSAFQTPVAIGILGFGGIMSSALVMYGMKQLMRSFSRKHLVGNPEDEFGEKVLPENLMEIHSSVRFYHQQLKSTLKENPSELRFNYNQKPWMNEKEMSNPIEAAEAVVAQGKDLLWQLENLMQDQKVGYPIDQEVAESLIIVPEDKAGTPTLLRQWEACVDSLRPQDHRAEIPMVKLDYDSTNNKIIGRPTQDL